jgi:hypothetical protein
VKLTRTPNEKTEKSNKEKWAMYAWENSSK